MQHIAQCLSGHLHGGVFGKGVVDDQVYHSGRSVLAGAAVDVELLPAGLLTAVDGAPHKLVPEQNGKVVGAGQEAAVLQKAVVGRGQRVVKDDSVCDGSVAAQLV